MSRQDLSTMSRDIALSQSVGRSVTDTTSQPLTRFGSTDCSESGFPRWRRDFHSTQEAASGRLDNPSTGTHETGHHRRRWALRAGQIATPAGPLPTVMGADTAPVAVVITDTVPSPKLAT